MHRDPEHREQDERQQKDGLGIDLAELRPGEEGRHEQQGVEGRSSEQRGEDVDHRPQDSPGPGPPLLPRRVVRPDPLVSRRRRRSSRRPYPACLSPYGRCTRMPPQMSSSETTKAIRPPPSHAKICV